MLRVILRSVLAVRNNEFIIILNKFVFLLDNRFIALINNIFSPKL